MAFGMQLSQRLSQSLVLAPQLQQSLALLQAPTLELKALVAAEMEQNPVLEEVMDSEADLREKTNEDGEAPAADLAEPPEDMKFDAPDTIRDKEAAEPVDDFQAEFDKLVQLDQDWRDHFSQASSPIRSTTEDEEKRQFMFDSLTVETSLAQHLVEQVRDTELNNEEQGIAELLIGNVDDYGYLNVTVDERFSLTPACPPEKISKVLKVIQGFEPVGVGARDLRECLMLQLERAGLDDTLEYRIIRDFMDALGKRRIPEIARGTNQSLDDVQEALARIGRLDPRPGRAFLSNVEQYVAPEVFVVKSGEDYTVTTNDQQIPAPPHQRTSTST